LNTAGPCHDDTCILVTTIAESGCSGVLSISVSSPELDLLSSLRTLGVLQSRTNVLNALSERGAAGLSTVAMSKSDAELPRRIVDVARLAPYPMMTKKARPLARLRRMCGPDFALMENSTDVRVRRSRFSTDM